MWNPVNPSLTVSTSPPVEETIGTCRKHLLFKGSENVGVVDAEKEIEKKRPIVYIYRSIWHRMQLN